MTSRNPLTPFFSKQCSQHRKGSNLLNIVPLVKIVKRVHARRQNHNTYHKTYGLAYVVFKIKWRMIKAVAE